MTNKKWEIKTEEYKLSGIIDYFVKAFKFKKDEELYTWEWFADPVHDKVFIKLTIKPLEGEKE